MTTEQVAQQYVAQARQMKFQEIQNELYGQNCVSIEPANSGWPERTEGMDAIGQKGQQFYSMVEEMHGCQVSDPVVAGNHFSCAMSMDVTFKGAPRNTNTELAVFEVADSKIVKEQFFYPPRPQS